MSAAPHLIAADFTLTGNVFPFGPTEVGPFSCEQKVEAAAKAGWDFGSPVTAMASMQYEPFTPTIWMLVPWHIFFNLWLRRAGCCSAVSLE